MKVSTDNLLRAVRAKCLDCSGGARKQVEGCTIRECPLWPYRSEKALLDGWHTDKNDKNQINMFEMLKIKGDL